METITQSKGIKIAAMIVRYLMGLIFFIGGLNGFLNFIPVPPLEGDTLTYMPGLSVTRYFFPMLKFFEIIAGVFLLSGFYVPLVLAILVPITLNIFMLHAAMALEGMPLSIFVLGGNILLAWTYRENFKVFLLENSNYCCFHKEEIQK